MEQVLLVLTFILFLTNRHFCFLQHAALKSFYCIFFVWLFNTLMNNGELLRNERKVIMQMFEIFNNTLK